ncbi:hypothetical protein [Pontibacter arcticus]|uniref:hypothetical protein n=1 Tax=Pontibacter arcticus TaxID=2080288 RepID=UPI001403DE64|nr:hypothetical protein [Pontibacter arcticus]
MAAASCLYFEIQYDAQTTKLLQASQTAFIGQLNQQAFVASYTLKTKYKIYANARLH